MACGGKSSLDAEVYDYGKGGTAGTGGFGGSGGSTATGGAGGTGATGGGPIGGSGGTSAGGSSGEAGAGGEGGGPTIRTIITRDPYENVDSPGNLLLDGGFEFSGSISYAWNSVSYDSLAFGHGVTCRSGVRCAILDPGAGMYGVLVSPKSGLMNVTLHTRTESQSCDGLTLYVLDANDQQGGGAYVTKQSAELGADGWCVWKGAAPAVPDTFPVLYVEASGERVVIDDVLVSLPQGEQETAHALSTLRHGQKPLSLQQKELLRKVAGIAKADITRSRKRPMTVRDVVPRNVRIAPWIR
jgi:hypothetical protein